MTWYGKAWVWLTRNFREAAGERVVDLVAPPQGVPDVVEPPTEVLPVAPPVTFVFLQERGTAVFIPIAYSDGHLIGCGSIRLQAEAADIKVLVQEKNKQRTACLRGFSAEEINKLRNNEQLTMPLEAFQNHLRDR